MYYIDKIITRTSTNPVAQEVETAVRAQCIVGGTQHVTAMHIYES